MGEGRPRDVEHDVVDRSGERERRRVRGPVAAVEERRGYQDVSTLKEPYRIEGKKTMGYEIAEQLGWQVPDVILYPAGGGVGLIGIHKAMQEMQELGWIGDRMPRLVAVQAAGCPPIVDAFEAGQDESTLVEDTHTLAFGLNVPKALAIAQTGDVRHVATAAKDVIVAQPYDATTVSLLVAFSTAQEIRGSWQMSL